MPAIDSLMKRLGFVKISRYGLVLTPDGRILSMRPAVLDDGFHGRIVGWKDGDLAAAELEKWEPARPAPMAAVARGVATPPPFARLPQATRPVPVVPAAPVAIARAQAVPMASLVPPGAPPIVTAPTPIVAQPIVEEDDWEWTIALARARAAAEETEQAVAIAAAPARRKRADTLPPPVAQPKFTDARTLPIAMVASEDTVETTRVEPTKVDSDGWPKTEPLGEIDYNDYTNPLSEVVRVVRLAETPRVKLPAKPTPSTPSTIVRLMPTPPAPIAVYRGPVTITAPTPVVAAPINRTMPRPGTSPATVIPIPKLPGLRYAPTSHLEPVVRSTLPTPMLPTSPRRFAKGTGPLLPRTASADYPQEETMPAPQLPPVAAVVGVRAQLPGVKRV